MLTAQRNPFPHPTDVGDDLVDGGFRRGRYGSEKKRRCDADLPQRLAEDSRFERSSGNFLTGCHLAGSIASLWAGDQ